MKITEKIKFYLFQIILTKRKNLLLVSLLVFGGLFLTMQMAQAWLDIPYNIASNQLERLDWVENSILRVVVWLAMLAAQSIAFLFISANLLDWASSLPIGLDNLLVNTGWQFMLGFVNLFFILIFIYIAFSFILKTETFKMKQALPRLIIIALLINFSMLLVNMLVDIGWIFQNSFRALFFEEQGLATVAMQPLVAGGTSLIALITAIPLGFLVLAAIPLPFVGVAGFIAMAAMVLGGEFLFGMISQTVILILFNFAFGLIFLVYAFLFLIRIGVIWLLAIIAPLAFMAYIMPGTQKYFQDWLKTLFSWVFLGVVLFFLMGLGISLFATAFGESGGPLSIAVGEGGSEVNLGFADAYYKYIFLLVYLTAVLFATKKLMPKGTEAVWALAEKGMSKGGQLTTDLSNKLGMRAKIGMKGGVARAARRLEEKRKARVLATATTRERMAGWFVRRRGGLELAEAQEKGLKAKLLDEKREKILSKAPKDTQARVAYLRGELLGEGQRGPLLDHNKIASLIDLIADSGKIGSTEEKFVADAIKHGSNEKKILDRRPDLAAAAGKTIEEVVKGMNAETLRKQTQKEAFENRDVMKHFLADESKFTEITFRASAEVKKLIKESFRKNATYLHPSNLPLSQRNAYKGRLKRMFQTDSRWKV